MAGNSTISIAFKLDGDDKGFKDLAKDADGLRAAMSGAAVESDKMRKSFVSFASVSKSLESVRNAISQVQGAVKSLTDAYAVQEVAEQKLNTVMRQRMGAADEEIDSIRELAKEQQKLGVIGDEVQLSGAQQMATYLSTSDSIKTLIPAMNDLIAQQDGLNATTGSAEAIAKAMGKAMEGQVGSLQRLGITFTDADARVMQFGTEEERAAVLAEVIENSVGGMNAALAATDSGKQKQLANDLGDVKERIGSVAAIASPFINVISSGSQAIKTVTMLGNAFGLTSLAMAKQTAALIANKVATLAVAAAQKVASAATKVWSGIQAVFNAILSANPIGLIVMAVGALVAAIVAAYKNCEGFRNIVKKVWDVIKKFVSAIVGVYVKAFTLMAEAVKKVVDWFKELFKFNNRKVKVEAEIKEKRGGKSTDEIRDNYAGTSGSEDAAFNAEAKTLKEISDNIAYYQKQLESATAETAAEINKQIEYWQEAENEIKNAGKTVKDTGAANDKVWHDNALSIEEVEENISILTERLNKATTQEARAELNALINALEAVKSEYKSAGEEAETTSELWHDQCDTLQDVRDNLSYIDQQLLTCSKDEAAYWNDMRKAYEDFEKDFTEATNEVEAYDNRWKETATTLKDINGNIDFLNEQLETATIEEASLINKQIAKWQEKADAIKNAGKEEEKSMMKTSDALRDGYSQTKNLTGGIESLNDALTENSTLWDKITGVIDAFLQIFDSVKGIIDIIKEMTQATQEQNEEEEQSGIISATTSAEKIASAAAETAADTAQGAAAETAATGEMTEAAAETFAAHASIPFVGIALAAASVAAMIATMLSMPKLASGGLATGPTLAMVGEYSGASSNPEVIAPLSKLRSMLRTDDDRYGQVEFRIEGRTLVGVLNKVNSLSARR